MSGITLNAKVYEFTADDVDRMYSDVKSNGNDPIYGMRAFFGETGRNPQWDEVFNLWLQMAKDCAESDEKAAMWTQPRQNFTTISNPS